MKIVKTKCGYMSKQKAAELGLLKKGYNMKNTKQTTKHKRSVAQHTAGEWGVSPKDDYYIYSKGDDSTIAKVYYGNEANARLIASAPLMLEALEAVEELNYRSDETDHNEVLIPVSVLEKVIQAIAKAKGE